MSDILVPILIRLHPEKLSQLLTVRNFVCPEESWDKTIGDAIDIALAEYRKLAEYVHAKKLSEAEEIVK